MQLKNKNGESGSTRSILLLCGPACAFLFLRYHLGLLCITGFIITDLYSVVRLACLVEKILKNRLWKITIGGSVFVASSPS